MNTSLKIIVAIVVIIGIGIGIRILTRTENNQSLPSSSISTTESAQETSMITSTEPDMELRQDRDGRARGAQKENKEASDLQNDLNNITNP